MCVASSVLSQAHAALWGVKAKPNPPSPCPTVGACAVCRPLGEYVQDHPEPAQKRRKADALEPSSHAGSAVPPTAAAASASAERGDTDSDLEIVSGCPHPQHGTGATAVAAPSDGGAGARKQCVHATGGTAGSARGGKEVKGGDPEEEEDEDEAADAWISRLSPAQLQLCGSAPALVIAKEEHQLVELRSVLRVRR